MPSVPSRNRFANRSIADCARDRMLMVMHCNRCRRQVNYWADDLAKVIEERHFSGGVTADRHASGFLSTEPNE